MQVNNNNNISFGAVKLPEFRKLSKAAQETVEAVDKKFNPTGFTFDAMFFKDGAQEHAARQMLQNAHIPHLHVADSDLPTEELRNLFATKFNVII